MVEFASLVVFSSNPARASAFYRAIGHSLTAEQHDGGLAQFACAMGSSTSRSTPQMLRAWRHVAALEGAQFRASMWSR